MIHEIDNELSSDYRIKLLDAFNQFSQLHGHRKQALFTEFLPRGHGFMTLGCVPADRRNELIFLKSLLGMHITLYDDLADNPKTANLAMLTELYKIPFENHLLNLSNLTEHERRFVDFSLYLTDQITMVIKTFTHYEQLKDIFEFDFKQFYNANQYYSLALKNINILNSWEIKFFGPFNMGMIIAGTIDIMASPTFSMTDLGPTRIVLFLAQRFGHICNTITTLGREIHEHTYSNEAIIIAQEQGMLNIKNKTDQPILDIIYPACSILKVEQEKILSELSLWAQSIKSWNAQKYVSTLDKLQTLHEQFLGII